MKGSVLCFIFVSAISSTLCAQFKNIKIADATDSTTSPLNPSVTINHKNPANIIVGMAVNRAIYTLDSGKTWQESTRSSAFSFLGDPAVISDAKGHSFYFNLSGQTGKGRYGQSSADKIVVQKSSDGGVTWGDEVSFANIEGKNPDRHSVAIHPRKQSLFSVWTQFDKYGDAGADCHSNIFFSKSSGGEKWSAPKQINLVSGACADDDNTASGAMPVVDSEGRVFVTWSLQGSIYMDRSYDGGDMWLNNDIVIAQRKAGRSMEIPRIGSVNESSVFMIDNSPGSFHGGLYLLWSDQKTENDTDIWFTRSANRGDNWTSPVKVNQDTSGKHQFFPWMTIDQATGYIYIVYYDQRDHDDQQTDVYLAYSMDGGNKFTEKKISESPFVPEKNLMSGHIGIYAHKSLIVPVWTRIDNGKPSVWTTVIRQRDLYKQP